MCLKHSDTVQLIGYVQTLMALEIYLGILLRPFVLQKRRPAPS